MLHSIYTMLHSIYTILYRDGFAYKKYSKMTGSGGQLAQLDWDNSGDYLQTASADHSLSFWSTASSKMEKVSSGSS